MAYADFEFYIGTFFGDTLTVNNADKWLSLASDEIDALTFGRLISAFPTAETHAVKVRKAVCAIAEALYNIDIQHKATAAQQASDGSYHGAVASVSSGRESISYAVNNSAENAYEQLKQINSIAAKYLANIPDKNGINLLYAGGG